MVHFHARVAHMVRLAEGRAPRFEGNRYHPKGKFLNVWLISFFTAFTSVNAPLPSLFASAAPQQARSNVQSPNRDNIDSRLDAIERDIAGDQFEEPTAKLNAYLKGHPDSWRAHYDLGYVQFRTHKIGPSILELSRSLALNPRNAEAHKILGLDSSIIGRYDLAETELLQAARLKPESVDIHYFLARTYYMKGVYPLAKSEFETTIRLDPYYLKAYSNLGITMEALGDNNAALKNYMMAIELQPRQKQRSEWPYIYLSEFYNRQSNPTRALDYARNALEVNRRSDAVYFEMAKAYRAQREWQKAAEALRSAIAINSQVPDYYYVLGLMLRQLGKQRESDQAMGKYAELKQSGSAGNELEQNALEPLSAPAPR